MKEGEGKGRKAKEREGRKEEEGRKADERR